MRTRLCFTWCILIACVLLIGCEDETGPIWFEYAPTGNDGFNDVTFLNGYLWTTNRELGREIHNPVYLYRLDPATGEALDRYFLDMTDQGFLSIANDGELLYLLRGGHSIVVVNMIGERIDARSTYPDFMDWMLSAGVYNADVDSLFFVTQQTHTDRTDLRIFSYDTPTREMTLVREATISERLFLTSLEYAVGDEEYFGIAFDENDEPLILHLDNDFGFVSSTAAPDTLVIAISRTATGWVLLTEDRRLMTWAPRSE